MPKPVLPPRQRVVLRDNQFGQADDGEVDFELDRPGRFVGLNANLVPMPSAVAGGRVFYGSRFATQAVPLVEPEAPLVQNLDEDDPDGRSFDETLGEHAGALRAKAAGRIMAVKDDGLDIEVEDGSRQSIPLYKNWPFNRMTRLTHTPTVKVGDTVKAGQLLAHSNYTDKNGTLAMGRNARIGLVPYLGRSMEDAIVVSEDFAKKMTSDHLWGYDLDYKRGVKGGKAHFSGLFVNKYTKEQLDNLDDDGVVKPGTVLNPGDPIILATRPRVISSASAQLGQLSKHMRNARTPAELVWDRNTPGTVVDVSRLKTGVKVNIANQMPLEVGDKLTTRSGNKGVIGHIIPSDRMPRTADGRPLDVLLNPLTLPSRMNSSAIYELLLGKVARKTGKPYKLPPFTKATEKWYDLVENELKANGLSDVEEVFDPALGRKLENPITVGEGFIQKLQHLTSEKMSARGQGAYDSDAQQPLHGGAEGAQSKRIGGLTTHALLSAGAYNFLRDAATVRGSRNDDYWRSLRQGHEPKEPGEPFAFSKFRALLTGAGLLAHKLPGNRERLRFMTQRDLEDHKPTEVKTGDLVDLSTLEPRRGGLFDPSLTGRQGYGYIKLPFPVINPAGEDVARKLLGLTEKEFRSILSGESELPAHLQLAK